MREGTQQTQGGPSLTQDPGLCPSPTLRGGPSPPPRPSGLPHTHHHSYLRPTLHAASMAPGTRTLPGPAGGQ